MAGRYVAIHPRAWVSATHTPESQPTCTVHETDKRPIETGLVDALGVPLYRTHDAIPLGFVGKHARVTKGT